MEVYLAGTSSYAKFMLTPDTQGYEALMEYKPNLLESFAYMNKGVEYVRQHAPSEFMLDSGAFTYMNGKPSENLDWDEYVKEYTDYINTTNVKYFFEMDIDSVVGYERVLELRKDIERLTDKRPIPVWHKARGIEEFKKMCTDYDYVSIGGFVTQEIKKPEYPKIAGLIEYAHKKNSKIHGLGFTALQWLPKLHFDSVDSTAWLSGTKYRGCYKFNGIYMTKIPLEDNLRIKHYKPLASHNFTEWCKFARYARNNL